MDYIKICLFYYLNFCLTYLELKCSSLDKFNRHVRKVCTEYFYMISIERSESENVVIVESFFSRKFVFIVNNNNDNNYYCIEFTKLRVDLCIFRMNYLIFRKYMCWRLGFNMLLLWTRIYNNRTHVKSHGFVLRNLAFTIFTDASFHRDLGNWWWLKSGPNFQCSLFFKSLTFIFSSSSFFFLLR